MTGSEEKAPVPITRSAIAETRVSALQSSVPRLPVRAGNKEFAQWPSGFTAGIGTAFAITVPPWSRATQVICASALGFRLMRAKPV